MVIIYCCMVMIMCINLGNSLERTKNQSPSEERFNFFDAELLQVFNKKEQKNLLISPISIKLVLGMLMEGAEDITADEIRTALRLPEEEDARRKGFSTWLSILQTKDSNILKIANRIFYSHHYTVNPDYSKTLQKYYSGGATSVNFGNAAEASKQINSWVGNETSQFISNIVEEGRMSMDNKLMVASAIYFKGLWSHPFSSERSSIKCFYSKPNKCEDSLMMSETGYFDYGYISRLDAKAIVLPYKGGKFRMMLLLPSKRNRIELLGRDLVHVSLSSILKELQEQEVFVQIPQFEISYNDDLVESLRNLQILEIFNRNANLSKIFTTETDSASITHIYHSAKIMVNEEGSEAAAATGALFVPLMGGTTTSFIANHPFLFFVMNNDKNSVLFAGKVISPQTSDSKKRVSQLNNVTFKQTQSENLQKSGVQRTNSTTKDSLDKTVNDFTKNQRTQQAGPKFRSIMPMFSRPLTYTRKRENGEASKSLKRQETSSDDWRHHFLFFT